MFFLSFEQLPFVGFEPLKGSQQGVMISPRNYRETRAQSSTYTALGVWRTQDISFYDVNVVTIPTPTYQAEILEEAKITEKLNAESLKRFRELELEAKKKANRSAGARVIKGHYVRYISTAMPLIEEVQDAVDDTEDTVDVDDTVGHGKKHDSHALSYLRLKPLFHY